MSAHPTHCSLPMTLTDFSHPSVCAGLTGPAHFIKIDTYSTVSWERLGSAKTTVKSAVPNDRKERAGPADEED